MHVLKQNYRYDRKSIIAIEVGKIHANRALSKELPAASE